MGVRNILADDLSILFIDLGIGSDDFNAFSARTSTWLHDVHVFVARSFSINTELSIVIREYICFWTEGPLVSVTLPIPLSTLYVLPH
jgi:hypothetical protein